MAQLASRTPAFTLLVHGLGPGLLVILFDRMDEAL